MAFQEANVSKKSVPQNSGPKMLSLWPGWLRYGLHEYYCTGKVHRIPPEVRGVDRRGVEGVRRFKAEAFSRERTYQETTFQQYFDFDHLPAPGRTKEQRRRSDNSRLVQPSVRVHACLDSKQYETETGGISKRIGTQPGTELRADGQAQWVGPIQASEFQADWPSRSKIIAPFNLCWDR